MASANLTSQLRLLAGEACPPIELPLLSLIFSIPARTQLHVAQSFLTPLLPCSQCFAFHLRVLLLWEHRLRLLPHLDLRHRPTNAASNVPEIMLNPPSYGAWKKAFCLQSASRWIHRWRISPHGFISPWCDPTGVLRMNGRVAGWVGGLGPWKRAPLREGFAK